MTIDLIREVLGWCIVMNVLLILWWFLFLIFAHDLVYRMHSRFFKVSVETFDAIHYAGIAFFKIVVFVLNIIPYFALKIIG